MMADEYDSEQEGAMLTHGELSSIMDALPHRVTSSKCAYDRTRLSKLLCNPDRTNAELCLAGYQELNLKPEAQPVREYLSRWTAVSAMRARDFLEDADVHCVENVIRYYPQMASIFAPIWKNDPDNAFDQNIRLICSQDPAVGAKIIEAQQSGGAKKVIELLAGLKDKESELSAAAWSFIQTVDAGTILTYLREQFVLGSPWGRLVMDTVFGSRLAPITEDDLTRLIGLCSPSNNEDLANYVSGYVALGSPEYGGPERKGVRESNTYLVARNSYSSSGQLRCDSFFHDITPPFRVLTGSLEKTFELITFWGTVLPNGVRSDVNTEYWVQKLMGDANHSLRNAGQKLVGELEQFRKEPPRRRKLSRKYLLGLLDRLEKPRERKGLYDGLLDD